MRLLVVHDRRETRAEVVAICREFAGAFSPIDEAADYVTARNLLSEHAYDIAIIDLTLPHVEGKQVPRIETAEALLSEVFANDAIHAPGDIIGITNDAAALTQINSTIGPHLMALVEENEKTPWKVQLSDRLTYVRRAELARQRSFNRRFDIDVCLITALDEEATPYQSMLDLSADVAYPGARAFVFDDHAGKMRRGILFSLGRAGPARSAAVTQALLSVYRPRLVLMSGFCGAMKGKLEIGDVVLFETVFDWDHGKWKSEAGGEPAFFARPEPLGIRDTPIHLLARDLVQKGLPDADATLKHARVLASDFSRTPAIVLAPAASGAAVVGHESITSKIRGLNEAIAAVDMEAYGLHLAVKTAVVRKPAVLCVKAVADYCDGGKNDDYHELASYLSARVAVHVLQDRFDFTGE